MLRRLLHDQIGRQVPVGETDEDAYRTFIQYGGVPGSEPPIGPAE